MNLAEWTPTMASSAPSRCSSSRNCGSMCRQLIQQYVQKSRTRRRPWKSSSRSGRSTLSHAKEGLKSGALTSPRKREAMLCEGTPVTIYGLMRDLTGSSLGRYEIKERLGAGGMASVYRAVQRPLGREVALKALSPALAEDEAFIRRFENEARVLATLDHPNILSLYDFDEQDGIVYL